MARRRRRNPEEELPYDTWIPAHAVMFNKDGTVAVMTEGAEMMPAPTGNRGRRRNVRTAGGLEFDGSTPGVMIKRSGYPLWLDDQLLIDPSHQQWRGRVATMTHPDYEMGEHITFYANEVKDIEE